MGNTIDKMQNTPVKAEYFVALRWLETRSEDAAVKEVEFFGNQNTVCKPSTQIWRHTVEKLKSYFTQWTLIKKDRSCKKEI
jgi:hypothetical protein